MLVEFTIYLQKYKKTFRIQILYFQITLYKSFNIRVKTFNDRFHHGFEMV